ncbi:WD40-repeat-containing domain protein [Trichophaea hybrida]|nr:WD40-repeat-containing domain protein [Trichophaea hybrida]
MDTFGSDDERDPGHGMENGGGSDNDEDEIMEDADPDQDEEEEEEPDKEDDEDDNENDDEEQNDEPDEGEGDQEEDSQQAPRSRSATQAPSRAPPLLRPGADTAPTYDIVPYVAAPQSTSINAFCSTPCMRWIFTGGSDGYIRRFDWFGSMNGRVPLTVAQKHPFVDSVTRLGILLSYWENEEPAVKSSFLHVPETTDDLKLSPVYSLAVQNQSLWLLSGLESGGINLQSVRHDEGKIITTLRKHTSAVSVLALAHDERSVLSGSWDKNIYDWDLNTGKVTREFTGSAGQISSVEFRSHISNIVWDEIRREPLMNGVSAGSRSIFGSGDLTNGVSSTAATTNGTAPAVVDANGELDAPGSPAESTRSFGSLFGEDEDIVLGGDGDEMSQAIVNGLDVPPPPSQENADIPMPDVPTTNGHPAPASSPPAPATIHGIGPPPLPPGPTTDQNTFLASSMDGTLRLWDRRCAPPIAVSHPAKGVPPWCMSACWSIDGNFLYAGRRNGTVEEYSVHKGLAEPTRTLKFPLGSGSVTAMTPMPNGRHLICASFDNLRLYDLKHQDRRGGPTVPFLIIPGHHGGVVSHLYVDRTCQYLVSTAGNRGWEGANTEVLLGYEIMW